MISDTFHSGLLGVAYFLCLLLTGVQSPYPATSVVTVSANTAQSGDTFVNSALVYCLPPTSLATVSTLVYACTVVQYTAGNVRLFDSKASMKTSLDSGFSNTVAAVLKDSLILGAFSFSTKSCTT